MKTRLIVMLFLLALSSGMYAQGPLTPPGAPAPTMKTLDQVEARIPIGTAHVTITKPGSYYLTTNLLATGSSPVVTVSTNDVVIDLNGYSIIGTGGTGNGISINNSDVTIRNGTIKSCYYHGIYSAAAGRCTFEKLRLLMNGTFSSSYHGIQAGTISRVIDCVSAYNGGHGVLMGTESTVVDSLFHDNTLDGIRVSSRAKVRNCLSRYNGAGGTGYGISVTSNDGVIEDNIFTNNDIGIYISGVDNHVENNQVKNNTVNYSMGSGNQINLLLCELPETIEWACTVRLAGSLNCTSSTTNGLTVTSDDVTIDLAGFTMTGPGNTGGHGIAQADGRKNLKVMNGTLKNWDYTLGQKAAIQAEGSNTCIRSIHVVSNYLGIVAGDYATIIDSSARASSSIGIQAGDYSLVQKCNAVTNSWGGIFTGRGCVVKECVVSSNIRDGLNTLSMCTISDVSASYNDEDGIDSGGFSTISGCTATYNGSNGIRMNSMGSIIDCTANFNTGDGIYAGPSMLISRNQCTGNLAGIHVLSAGSRIQDNNVNNNTRGLDVDAAGNFIVRNTASGNTTDYSISGTQTIGPIVTATGTITNMSPWANFEY